MGRIGSFEKTVNQKASETASGYATDVWENDNGVKVGIHLFDTVITDHEFNYELNVEIGDEEFGGPDEDLFQGASDKVTRMRGEAADVMRDIVSGDLIDQGDGETVSPMAEPDAEPSATASSSLWLPTTSGGTNGSLEQKVRSYLKEWYPEVEGDTVDHFGTELTFEIDWSDVEIIVSGRMTSSSGRARWYFGDDGKAYELKISKHLIDNQSWERVQQTIRHEAIHIWQYQTDGFSGKHGSDFKVWMREFGCTVNAERSAADPKYEVVCEKCGVVGTRHRKCKITKKTYLYNCATCGGDLTVNKLR